MLALSQDGNYNHTIMTMEWPTEADFDKGILNILENDVNGESLQHLTVAAMGVVLDGLQRVRKGHIDGDAREVRQVLSRELLDSFADDTEFSVGKEIEIGESSFYLLHDTSTDYFVVQQLAADQKLVGSIATIAAIDTKELVGIESKVGAAVRLGSDTIPDAPAILLEGVRFITPEGKSHALLPQLRALIPFNTPNVHPRVAVPQESNAAVSF